METQSECELHHPNPPMPHYALSEGVLPLDLPSKEDMALADGRSASLRGSISVCGSMGGSVKGSANEEEGGGSINLGGSGSEGMKITNRACEENSNGLFQGNSATSAVTLKADDDDEGKDDEEDDFKESLDESAMERCCEHLVERGDEPGLEEEDEEEEAKDPNLVHFQPLSRCFAPDEDIFLIYELGDEITPTASDWIALLPSTIDYETNAGKTRDHRSTSANELSSSSETEAPPPMIEAAPSSIAEAEVWTPEMNGISVWKEAAPQTSTNKDFPYLRSILVNLASLSICPSDSVCYSFVFVSSVSKRILGRSSSFGISENPCLDAEVKDITSILEVLVDVGDIPGLDSGSLKHLKSFMEPVQHRSEPDCVVSFKRRTQSSLKAADAQQARPLLIRPAGRRGAAEFDEGEEYAEDDVELEEDAAEACLWDRDGSVEDLLMKMEKESSKILKSVSTIHSFMTVASENNSFFSIDGGDVEGVDSSTEEGGGGGGGIEGATGGKCATCNGLRNKLDEMKRLQEESKKQIAEVQKKLKEGKEKLSSASGSQSQFLGAGSDSSSLRTRKLEEKLRNLRLSKRRLEDELVEAIGRAARSKEEVMEIRQTLHENANKMDSNFAEIAELRTEMASKEKELKDLHEYVENIHYTLSTKGIRKENGDDCKIELNGNGKLVDLDQSWNVSESRKKGAMRAKLTNQSGVIDHLHHTLGRLDKERGDALRRAEMAEKTVDVQQVEISKLKEAVAKMKQEASKAANRVESLSKIIIQERQTLQTRMEKVREALKKVDSARKLKLATVSGTGLGGPGTNGISRSLGGAGGGGGGGGGCGWASGSDRAASTANRKFPGQEPMRPPYAQAPGRTNSAGGGVGGGGGGGACGGGSGRSRFVSPSFTPPPSAAAAASAFCSTITSTDSSGSRGRHQADPDFPFVPGNSDEKFWSNKGAKSRRRSKSRDHGRRCPVCRDPFSPVATKASIQNHINSHNNSPSSCLTKNEAGNAAAPANGNYSANNSSWNSSNGGSKYVDRGRDRRDYAEKVNEGGKDGRRDGRREGETAEGKKEAKKEGKSSKGKVAGLTKRWNEALQWNSSVRGNTGRSSPKGADFK